MKKTLLFSSTLVGTFFAVHAHDNHTVKTHEPHVHGEAQLNVVLDGDELTFDLDSPAMNFLGFEHAPSTDAQKALVEQVEHTLEKTPLFNIGGGNCVLHDADVEMPFGEHHDEHEHKEGEHKHEHEHKEGEHKHEHEHKEGEHNHEHEHKEGEHNHEHEHKEGEHNHEHNHTEGEHEEVHSDIRVVYDFDCGKPSDLNMVTVNLFKTFPNLHKLNVQWVLGNKQGAKTLTPEDNVIDFAQ